MGERRETSCDQEPLLPLSGSPPAGEQPRGRGFPAVEQRGQEQGLRSGKVGFRVSCCCSHR